MLELQNVRSAGLYKFTVTCKAANKGGSRTANATIEILGKFINGAYERKLAAKCTSNLKKCCWHLQNLLRIFLSGFLVKFC